MMSDVLLIQPTAHEEWCSRASNDGCLGPSIIDVEASGFGAASYPIEVGGQLRDGSRFSWLIQPMADWTHWDARAERLHGLSRERLERDGLPALEVCLRLNSLLAGQTVYSDAWYHDFGWIARLFHDARVGPRFRVESLQKLFRAEELERWPQVLDACWREQPAERVRHRALCDAAVLQQSFVRMRNTTTWPLAA
jgi:hypothetical protein